MKSAVVERRSRYVCLVRVTGKETRTVVRALTRHVQRLPAGLMRTLTWDSGIRTRGASLVLDRHRSAGLLL